MIVRVVRMPEKVTYEIRVFQDKYSFKGVNKAGNDTAFSQVGSKIYLT